MVPGKTGYCRRGDRGEKVIGLQARRNESIAMLYGEPSSM
jgi:hypothetical protein